MRELDNNNLYDITLNAFKYFLANTHFNNDAYVFIFVLRIILTSFPKLTVLNIYNVGIWEF